MRTYYDAYYLSSWLEDPVKATLQLDYGWRPKVDDPRWTYGHLRAEAQISLIRCAIANVDLDDALHAVIGKLMNESALYRRLELTAPLTRYVMQPEALITSIVAWADWAYDSWRERIDSGAKVDVERKWQKPWQWGGAERPRMVLCGSFDVVIGYGSGVDTNVDTVLELKATSGAVDEELLRRYRNSVQSRLYQMALVGTGAEIEYDIWSVGSKRSGYAPRFYPPTPHRPTEPQLVETWELLRATADQLLTWQSQDMTWASEFPRLPVPWRGDGRKYGDIWQQLWSLPYPEREDFVEQHFERRLPWDPMVGPQD